MYPGVFHPVRVETDAILASNPSLRPEEAATLALERLYTKETPAAPRIGNSAPPTPSAMGSGINNRIAERIVNSGMSLADFKALGRAEQQTLLQQLAAEEQAAMIQGFDAAKLGFDVSNTNRS